MNDTDAIIDSILNEDDIKIDYNTQNYDLNDIIFGDDTTYGLSKSDNKEPKKELLNDILKKSPEETYKKWEKEDRLKKELAKKKEEEEIQKKIKEEEEMLKKKREDTNKMVESFCPQFKNPLECIQYFEVESINAQISLEMTDFILQNFSKKDIKYEVTEINNLNKINSDIEEKKLEIFSITAKANHLIICTNDNIIYFYSLGEQKFIKKIEPKKLNKDLKDSYINCIDVADDFSEAVCGFDDGTLVIINVYKEEIRYINNKVYKDCSVIEVKVQEKDNDKEELSFISSGSQGKAFYHTYKIKSLNIFTKFNSEPIIIGNKTPIYLIKLISSPNSPYANLKELKRYMILGSQEVISFYGVNPMGEILHFKKPEFIEDNVAPDAQLGIGRPPDVFMRFLKKDEKNHLILIISWGKVLYFYQLPIANRNEINGYKELGYYVNTSVILRCGFLNLSVVYILDKSFCMKILDSSKINAGTVSIENNKPVVPKNNSLAEIEKSRLVSPNISSQFLVNDSQGQPKDTYLHTVADNIDLNNTVVVLSDKQISNVKLINWEKFLNNLQNKGNFINLLSLGIDLYKGKMTALSNIPKKMKNREENELLNYLKTIVSQYVILNTGEKKAGGLFLEETDEIEKISRCMKVAIEFCIEIEEVEFLLNSIEPLFEMKEYGELFLTKLQPFILCDKVANVVLSSNIILNIIELYNKNDRLDILSQVLLHVNIQSIEPFEIRKKLEDIYLIQALIYLYMNGQKEDYFAPLEKMFMYFTSRATSAYKILYNEETDCIDYSNAINKKLITQKEVRNSKEYNGHKIFWYIRWCLTGKKYPDNTIKMDQAKFDELVPKIVYWLLNPKVIEEFLKFDPKNYFIIHKNIFSIDELREKLEKAAKNSTIAIEVKSNLSSADIRIEDIEPVSLIKYLSSWCKKKNSSKIYFFLYDFITSILNKNINLGKDLKLEAICYRLKNYKNFVKQVNHQEVKLFVDFLINILETEPGLTNDNYIDILHSINTKVFNELRLYLYDKIDNYQDCLKLYLDENCNIPDKATRVYKWIGLKIAKYKGTVHYDKFINLIKDNTLTLATLNLTKFYELTKLIFQGNTKIIILKLKSNKKIQLAFIEILIKFMIVTYENNENNVPAEEMPDIKFMLSTHIQLLCDFQLFNKIVPALKMCNFYSLSDCLISCEKAKAYEPCLYLYLKSGLAEKAFKLVIEYLDESFNELLKTNDKEIKKEFDEKLKIYKKYFSDIKKICENPQSKTEDLWFKILGKLYEYEMKSAELAKKIGSKKLNIIIVNDIKELMDKMCSFVSIKRILEVVCEKNKNAGFKEFRELIIKLLTSYSNLTNILCSARQLLTNSILENEHNFQFLNLKGEPIDSPYCGKCNVKLVKQPGKKEIVYIFNCTHIFHKNCINKEGRDIEIVCPICNEFEFLSYNNEGKSLISQSTSVIEEKVDDKNTFHVKVDASKRKTLQKFERFDDRNLEKHKLMINNSLNVLIDQYNDIYKNK